MKSKGQLTLILGPMASGKSFDMVAIFAPLRHTDAVIKLYQPQLNMRDEKIQSRLGVGLDAEKITSLCSVDLKQADYVGIDEVHMFPAEEASVIEQLLLAGIDVVVSGLDLDYRGQMFDIIKSILELGPTEVRYKKAVCCKCRTLDATYTQIFHLGAVVTDGLPAVVPQDGTYAYKSVCRRCFVKRSAEQLEMIK